MGLTSEGVLQRACSVLCFGSFRNPANRLDDQVP